MDGILFSANSCFDSLRIISQPDRRICEERKFVGKQKGIELLVCSRTEQIDAIKINAKQFSENVILDILFKPTSQISIDV